jgi:phenylacetyl-CoA:acceptor oxidoreductase subunit 2
MTATLDGSPRLQRSWDSRAALNFIGGGAGSGLLVAAGVALAGGQPYFPAGAVAVVFIGFGLSMVWMEIGRPFRALNVFLHPQTSWMSREALVALPLFAFAGATLIVDQVVSLPPQLRLPVAPLGLVTAALALGFLFCQGRMFRASRGVPAWREPSLQIVIIVSGIAEGLGLLLALGSLTAASPTWIVATTLVALVARAAALEGYRRRVKLTIPEPAVTVLSRASVWVHLLGHLLPAILLIGSLMVPSSVVSAAVAGLALFATGAWLKFVVVTRAGFTQGFSIPFVPVRGRSGTALAAHR